MKKKVFFMAVLSALLVGCTSKLDVPEEDSPGFSADRQEVKFTFSGFSGGEVPYTKATTPAYGDESKIERMDVYVFQGGVFEEVFSNITLHGSGNDRTATIGLKGKNVKKLYFVANGNHLSLKTLIPGVTATTDFEELLTDILMADTKELLACPLLLTGSADVTMANVDATPNKVTLKRTVARFDIENDARMTNFYLKYVTLNNINTQSYIFNNDTKRYVASTTTKPYVWNKIQYNLRNNANTGLVNSLFYLYPQKGQAIADGGAYITIEGEVGEYPNNVKVIFDVPFVDKATGNPIFIDANTRYVFKINAANQSEVDATISTQDWVNDNSIEESLDSGGLQLVDSNGTPLTADNLTLSDNTPDEIEGTFYVKTTSEWEIELPTWAKITKIKVDGKGVCTQFKLTVPKNQHVAARSAVITLINKMRPSLRQSIFVTQTAGTPDNYPGTTLKGTEVGGIIWAPVNVGDTDGTTNGSLFQWGRGDAPFNVNSGDPDPASVVGPLSKSDAASTANKAKFIKLETVPVNPLPLAYRGTFVNLCKSIGTDNFAAYNIYNYEYGGNGSTNWNGWYEAEVRNKPAVRDEIVATILHNSFGFENLAAMVPPYDWNTTQDNNLWSPNEALATGVNPCPAGWRVPTEAEYQKLYDKTRVSKLNWEFTDNITNHKVAFNLPNNAMQISSSGELNTKTINPVFWTSESVVSQVILDYDYDAITNKSTTTRTQDVYKSKCITFTDKATTINLTSKERASAYYVRCVLND